MNWRKEDKAEFKAEEEEEGVATSVDRVLFKLKMVKQDFKIDW